MRGSRMNPGDGRTRSIMSVVIVMGLCGFFYILGAWQKSGTGRGDSIALRVTKETDCTILPNLHFETHHTMDGVNPLVMNSKAFKPCHIRYSDYTPCQDQNRAMKFPRENMTYRERHCPAENEKLHCLIPAPKGYVTPFPWPKSRDYVPYANAPYKSLTVEKAVQNWIQYQGDVFHFPGGGTMFPNGANAYIDELASVIPLADGTIRTALDTGCGVASWGAYLMDRNILTMSFAPRDSHEAQVQFALERGVPAVIGVLGTIKLPYPSRSFDMAHCSRCLIPWKSNDGMYMMEVDRVLRPGGYWILSGPPINWKTYYKTWKRSKQDAEEEQNRIENIAEMLCWDKIYEKGDTVIWQKRGNSNACHNKDGRTSKMCKVQDADDTWYKKMEACITPIPDGAQLQKFPERLFAVPPRILEGTPGVTEEAYEEDKKLWKEHVDTYKRINKLIGTSRYRNILDMNAGLGSFAAVLDSHGSWVMNVVPTISDRNTLGIIYERGLIGIYHDWCEAFSTYPRTYDLIHANGVFSLYQNKCDLEDILLEMDRILRPEGAVILRDSVEVLNKVRGAVAGKRWKSKLLDHEDGPLVPEKILIAVKDYWVHTSDAALSTTPAALTSDGVLLLPRRLLRSARGLLVPTKVLGCDALRLAKLVINTCNIRRRRQNCCDAIVAVIGRGQDCFCSVTWEAYYRQSVPEGGGDMILLFRRCTLGREPDVKDDCEKERHPPSEDTAPVLAATAPAPVPYTAATPCAVTATAAAESCPAIVIVKPDWVSRGLAIGFAAALCVCLVCLFVQIIRANRQEYHAVNPFLLPPEARNYESDLEPAAADGKGSDVDLLPDNPSTPLPAARSCGNISSLELAVVENFASPNQAQTFKLTDAGHDDSSGSKLSGRPLLPSCPAAHPRLAAHLRPAAPIRHSLRTKRAVRRYSPTAIK